PTRVRLKPAAPRAIRNVILPPRNGTSRLQPSRAIRFLLFDSESRRPYLARLRPRQRRGLRTWGCCRHSAKPRPPAQHVNLPQAMIASFGNLTLLTRVEFLN